MVAQKEGRCAASRIDDVWAMDFVHDQLATGAKLRILSEVDTFSRFSPAVVPRFRFRAPDVIDVLEQVCAKVGYPAPIRVDQAVQGRGCSSYQGVEMLTHHLMETLKRRRA